MFPEITWMTVQTRCADLMNEADDWRAAGAARAPRRGWRRVVGEALIRVGRRLTPAETPGTRQAPRFTRTAS